MRVEKFEFSGNAVVVEKGGRRGKRRKETMEGKGSFPITVSLLLHPLSPSF